MTPATTVFVENAEVLHQREYPQDQYMLRLHAPRCSSSAKPGQFVHLQCGDGLKMRRPYSIMSTSPERGSIEILYKEVGLGSRLLGEKRKGDVLSVVGPIGNGFVVRGECKRPLLLGGGVGVPPVFFLAQSLANDDASSPFVIFASERPFPFPTCESKIAVAGVDDQIRRTHATLESLGIPARLCSNHPYPGCFNGFIREPAELWLSKLAPEEKSEVEIFACGPKPMLAAVAAVAKKHELPCQLSLEEYMACAVGGCAGCTVPTLEQGRPAMKRVCVDGPVFDAASLHL